MQRIIFLLIPVILISCSKNKTTEPPSLNTGSLIVGDTLLPVLTKSDTGTLYSYIGFIYKFNETNTFYTDLYFAPGVELDVYEELSSVGNVIYQDEEIKRTKLPLSNALPYFELAGLSRVTLYNRTGKKLTNGRFSHIEYYEDLIEGKFIAAFDVENTAIPGVDFCIGNFDEDLQPLTYSTFEDTRLQSEILDFTGAHNQQPWQVTHYLLNDKSVYTALSVDTTSFIVTSKNNRHEILYKSKFSESIAGLTFLSKKVNDQYILLVNSGQPETDFTWQSLLVFNGREYEPSPRNVIATRNLHSNIQ
jgi:hypothetical protein